MANEPEAPGADLERPTSADPRPRPTTTDDDVASVSASIAAVRAVPYGGTDDATRALDLPPEVRAAVSPAITVLRWGALGYGLAFAAPEAARGSYAAVVAMALCLFVTTWRTVLPVRLGSRRGVVRLSAIADVVVLGIATGIGGAVDSPFVFCLLAAVTVVAFGWGTLQGLGALALGLATVVISSVAAGDPLGELVDDPRDWALAATLLFGCLAAGFVRDRLVDAEDRRGELAGQVRALDEANQLLTMLNTVARTLPNSLTLREALERTRRQLADTFDARVVCLLTLDEHAEEWVPKLSDGCVLRPAYPSAQLPAPLALALGTPDPLLVPDLPGDRLDGVAAGSGSGLYVRLEARDTTIGLLGLEHPHVGHFDDRSVLLLEGLSDVLALTVDNARWFGRLRSLGAEEERVRIARDLHDRLGQWLTYISFELERIIDVGPERTEDLAHLQRDVQAAIDELRETLRQLRAGVTDDLPLSLLGQEVVTRFAERADVAASFTATHPDDRLPIPVENELLRILQESLNNVDRHAKAEHVQVTWNLDGGNYELVIHDDGRGFDTARGVRDSAYGLVGMRERADVIGARLEITSRPGHGTTVRVIAGRPRTEEVMT